MKILFLTHQFFPEYQTGTERFVLNNALMTQRFGNKVKVITYSYYKNAFYDHEVHGILYKEFFFEGISVLAFKFKQIPKNLNLTLHNNLLFAFAKSVLEVESPDLVHVGHPMRVHEFIWASKDLGIPYIITLTDFFLLCPKVNLTPDKFSLCSGPNGGEACAEFCPELNPPFIQTRLSNSKELLKSAKKIISPSKFVANMFRKEFFELEISIIPHGIRYTHIKENNSYYYPGDRIIFGYLGNLIYHKGVHVLLTAFENFSNSNIHLKIFGFGQENFVKQLKTIASNDPRVTFNGVFKSESLGDIFNQIDVLVVPTLCYETYSFVLHEAFACNVPVIASNFGTMRERIQGGYNGIKFEPGDSFDLQKKLKQLIEYPDMINRMKENIKRDIIVPRLEQEAYLYLSIYDKITNTI